MKILARLMLVGLFAAVSVPGVGAQNDEMEITVKGTGGLGIKAMNVVVHSDTTVADLKEIIKQKAKIPTDRQGLLFRKTFLKSVYRLGDYAIQEGATVNIMMLPASIVEKQERKAADPFQRAAEERPRVVPRTAPRLINITVGEVGEFSFSPNAKLEELKNEIEKHDNGIPFNDQRLLLDGMELSENYKKLGEYGIRDGVRLELVDAVGRSMTLSVRLVAGKPIILEGILLDDTIQYIKQRIDAQKDTAVARQILGFGGAELDDDSRTLADYNVRRGDSIFLTTRLPRSININVGIPDGRTIPVSVGEDDKAVQVKVAIQKINDLEPRFQRLLFHGRELRNRDRLDRVGIHDGETLELRFKFD